MRSQSLLLVLIFSAATAHAQQRVPAADPASAAADITYDSVFSTYQPYRDQPLRNWAEVNQDVAATGGHAGIFRSGSHGQHAAPKAPAEAPLGQGQSPVRTAPSTPAEKHQH